MTPRVGVVVMAYGTPAGPDDVEPYYTHIRRGRPPTPEQLSNLTHRYEALGGISTLAARTRDQVAAIAATLEQREPGRYEVRLGQKHASPFIEDAVSELVDSGVERVVGLVLAPHYSGASVGEYQARAAEAAGAVPFTPIDRWHDEPAYRDFLGAAVRDGLGGMPESTEVVFTAHSLPERVLEGDPYPEELLESAEAVATAIGLGETAGSAWSVAWQSAGATPEPWRGPDILEVLRSVAESGRADALLVCPQGFVADHLEVAYDLDIEAAALAEQLGVGFARTRVLNDDSVVMAALAERVVRSVESAVHGDG